MTLIRAQVSYNADSALPRDALVNVLHFEQTTPLGLADTGWQAIADDIARVMAVGWSGASCEVVVKLYDVGDAKPRPIKATAIRNAGLHPASPMPREVSICLSFYAGRNLPRQRGRIFLPCAVGIGSGSLAARPGTIVLDKVMALASTSNQSLPDIGGIDVQHVVYSPSDAQARKVTNYYCDDEWDTQRSRGLKPTTRRTLTREG